MKQLFLFVLLSCTFTVGTLSAQACCKGKKTCSKTAEASASTDQAYVVAASDAASKDATIEKRVCEKSGKVCFYRNSKDANGASASTEVMYDQATATFVNLAATGENAKACSSGKKACCKGAKSCSKDKEVKSENKIMN